MKTALSMVCAFCASLCLAPGQVPGIVNFQGKLIVQGTNFNGTAAFKFALITTNLTGGDRVLWSHNGTSVNGSEPADPPVWLPVTLGIFSVNLGDNSVSNMTQSIPAAVFTNGAVYLRIWVNDGLNGSQPLNPNLRMTAAGYAQVAQKVLELDAGQIPSLDASKIGTGTIAEGRLSTTIARSADVAGQITSTSNGLSTRLAGTNDALLTLVRALTAQVASLSNQVAALTNVGGATFASADSADAHLLALGLQPIITAPSPTWQDGASTNAPTARFGHSAVWTGQEMIVWGGRLGSSYYSASGASYRPGLDSWEAVSAMAAPSARSAHTAIWTGREMIVWGGFSGSSYLGTGGRFCLSNQTWSTVATVGAPAGRDAHLAVWTGTRMLIWGGRNEDGYLGDGALYDPTNNTWTALALDNAPETRAWASAVWTGDRLLVWGGDGTNDYVNSGAQLLFTNGVPARWTAISLAGAPSARIGHTAIWTGSRMMIWGGHDSGGPLGDGAAYDPANDSWTALAVSNAPMARSAHTAIWTGTEMVIFGGETAAGTVASGAAYRPATDQWRGLSNPGSPQARSEAAAVWTGTEVIFFGGRSAGSPLAALQRLTPQPTWYFFRKP